MKTLSRAHLLLGLGLLATALIYLPGLSGGWLVDDAQNLGALMHSPAGRAPYTDIVFGNVSGPLGRPVAMATFAANHVLDLFSTTALKATNVAIHLLNGLLLFLLLARLFRRRPPLPGTSAAGLAAVISLWWLLLPLHMSTVLYIVQRMTELAATFALASCLGFVMGRQALAEGRRAGLAGLIGSLGLLFPLALLAKESAVMVLPWLLLLELFFFRQGQWPAGRLQRVLGLLLLAGVVAGTLLVLFPPRFISGGYLLRDFSLGERLLTQPRVLWSYMGNLFLPDSQAMGLFHDDVAVSRSLLSPWTTLSALLGLLALAGLALRLAESPRWWPLALGLLLYFSGQLLESSVIALELYFEHRNYLPSVGLLIAALPLAQAWPWRRSLLLLVFGLYLGLLAVATLGRAQIWGQDALLLSVSATRHPHSLRAWTDYVENLLAQGQPAQALAAARQASARNPRFAAVLDLQQLTLYCRLGAAPPPDRIRQAGLRIAALEPLYGTSLSIGLEYLLTLHQQGHCNGADFSPLAPALLAQDRRIRAELAQRRGRLWWLRFNIAEWLLELGQKPAARDILRDTWAQGPRENMPMAGLLLARILDEPAQTGEKQKVLTELEAVTADAPPDFREQMRSLYPTATGAP